MRALLIVLSTTFIFGMLGFVFGKFFVLKSGMDFLLPQWLLDKDSFIIVGTIHTFSYIGGFIGLVVAILYLTRLKRVPVSSNNHLMTNCNLKLLDKDLCLIDFGTNEIIKRHSPLSRILEFKRVKEALIIIREETDSYDFLRVSRMIYYSSF